MVLQYSLAIMLGLGIGLGVLIYELVQQNSYERYQQNYRYAHIDLLGTQKSLKAITAKTTSKRRKPKKEEEELCVICSEPLSLDNITVLSCKHRFHKNCIKKWFQLCKTTKCIHGCC